VKHAGEQSGNSFALYVYFIVKHSIKFRKLGSSSYENVYCMVGDKELGCFFQFSWLVAQQNAPDGFCYTLPRRQTRVLIMEIKVPITLLCP
jgi:hypothetical protein